MILKDSAIQTMFAHLRWSHQRNKNIRIFFFFPLTRNSIIYFLNVELSLFPWIFCYFLKLQQGTPTSTGAQLGLGLRVDGVTLILDQCHCFSAICPETGRSKVSSCRSKTSPFRVCCARLPLYACHYGCRFNIKEVGKSLSFDK